ncbi:hypothetical protein TcasGA2_TC016116 [Tribolium castaneum]|uniref:Uncharacterized protein n=1 Tax=Tribolium castaneum TaxID=7070 RepID=D7EIQ7_TRICA|nr:hypothetical protein TcasGA2_TC016116 [Tribolium castaneum]
MVVFVEFQIIGLKFIYMKEGCAMSTPVISVQRLLRDPQSFNTKRAMDIMFMVLAYDQHKRGGPGSAMITFLANLLGR